MLRNTFGRRTSSRRQINVLTTALVLSFYNRGITENGDIAARCGVVCPWWLFTAVAVFFCNTASRQGLGICGLITPHILPVAYVQMPVDGLVVSGWTKGALPELGNKTEMIGFC